MLNTKVHVMVGECLGNWWVSLYDAWCEAWCEASDGRVGKLNCAE